MKAFEFIKQDQKRFNPTPLLVWGGALIITVLSATLGLILRRDLVEAFALSNLLPGAVVLTPLLLSFWLYTENKISYSKKRLFFLGLLILSVFVSFLQPQTTVSLVKFSDSSHFWPETAYCFSLGMVLSLIGAFLILTLIWRFFPVPSHPKQIALSVLCGVFGVAGLTFHCMGALKTHILYAHWGQALFIGSCVYWVQRMCFSRKIQKSLELKNNEQIINLFKLG